MRSILPLVLTAALVASPAIAQPTPSPPADAGSSAPSQPGQATVRVEPMETTVGGRVTATVTVVWLGAEPSAAVRFPTWQDTWGDAEVLGASDVAGRTDDAGRRVWTQTLELTAWEAGLIDLPSITVSLPLDERTVELTSANPAAAFTIVSLLPDDASPAAGDPSAPQAPGTATPGETPAELQPRPAAPPEALRRAHQSFLMTAGGLLLALSVATALLLRRLGAIPIVGGDPADEGDPYADMAPLDELMARLDHLDPAGGGPAHTGLSLALRRFLGRRLDAPSVESTTTEIQRDLQRRPLPTDLGQRVVALLRECDLVKFAGVEADAATTDGRLDQARALAERLEQHLAPREPDQESAT